MFARSVGYQVPACYSQFFCHVEEVTRSSEDLTFQESKKRWRFDPSFEGFQRTGEVNLNTRLLDTSGSYGFRQKQTRAEEFGDVIYFLLPKPTLWPSLFLNLRYVVSRPAIQSNGPNI
jgi:hypothetical protein